MLHFLTPLVNGPFQRFFGKNGAIGKVKGRHGKEEACREEAV